MRRIATLLSLVLVAAAAVPTAARASSTPAVSIAPDSAHELLTPAQTAALVSPSIVADSVIVAQVAAIDRVATLEVHAQTTPTPSPGLAAAVDTAEHTASLSRSTMNRSRSASRGTVSSSRSLYRVGAAVHGRLRSRALVRS